MIMLATHAKYHAGGTMRCPTSDLLYFGRGNYNYGGPKK